MIVLPRFWTTLQAHASRSSLDMMAAPSTDAFLWRLLGAVYFHLLDFRDAVMFATSPSGTGIVLIHRDISCGLMTVQKLSSVLSYAFA